MKDNTGANRITGYLDGSNIYHVGHSAMSTRIEGETTVAKDITYLMNGEYIGDVTADEYFGEWSGDDIRANYLMLNWPLYSSSGNLSPGRTTKTSPGQPTNDQGPMRMS